MPKKGEKARKIRALSRGIGVRPPKKWYYMMERKTHDQYPEFGTKRIGQIVGGIWSRMSIATKKKVVRKYQR